jgi:hypothetical protein
MENTAAMPVARGRLALSRAPVAELAAAAIRAQEASGLEPQAVDFVVIAMPAGNAEPAALALARAALELEGVPAA